MSKFFAVLGTCLVLAAGGWATFSYYKGDTTGTESSSCRLAKGDSTGESCCPLALLPTKAECCFGESSARARALGGSKPAAHACCELGDDLPAASTAAANAVAGPAVLAAK